jgi:hypothetical protein
MNGMNGIDGMKPWGFRGCAWQCRERHTLNPIHFIHPIHPHFFCFAYFRLASGTNSWSSGPV